MINLRRGWVSAIERISYVLVVSLAVIWIAACIVGFVILFSFYFFHPHAFAESLRRASFWGATWRGFRVWGVYKQVAAQIGRACPALVLALPVALATYVVWPRTRYFGNLIIFNWKHSIAKAVIEEPVRCASVLGFGAG